MSLFTGGVESLKVTNALAQFSGGLSIAAAAALYLDGGFDTYIQESSANTVAHFAGGTGRFFVSSVNVLANTTLSVASGFEFNLLGSAGSNFARLTYTPAGSTTLTIDNGFNDLAAEIRLRTCTTAAPVNCLVLSGNLCTFNPRVVITKGDTSEAAPHLQLIDTASGFAGAHWMDATAYYINQNAGGRQVRVSSGANSAIGVALVAGATAWANYSDERMKDIIEPITNAAAKVSSMRHVIGTLKSDDNKTRRAMLIAQDVLKVLPEAVSVDRDEYLLLEYSSLIPLHGAAIAEHEARIRALEGKLQ
jgi:hypothetical protein